MARSTPRYKKIYLSTACITVLTALFSYVRTTMHIKEFYTLPYSVGEIEFDDHRSLVFQASQDISNCRKCICIWVSEHTAAVFDELTYKTTFVWKMTSIIYMNIQNKTFWIPLVISTVSQNPYVLVVGPDCARKIDSHITPTFMNTLCKRYSYNKYIHDSYFFYIN